MRRLRRGVVVVLCAGLWGCPPTGEPPAYAPTLLVDEGVTPDLSPGTDAMADAADADADAVVDDAEVAREDGAVTPPPDGDVPDPACVDHDGDGFVEASGCPGDLPAGDCAPRDPMRAPGRPEVCNLVDDDCDGRVDEDGPGEGADCTTDQPGVCAAGVTVCAQGELHCDQVERRGLRDTCNGLDDDCDGQTDEEGAGSARCDSGELGVCGPGRDGCVDGAVRCVPEVQATAETCNGLDDDCDGQTDEDDPGGGEACPTGLDGVCAQGVQRCGGGRLGCVATVQPGAETCNGLDDNCDGDTDEAFPDLGATCAIGVGACARESARVCTADGTGTTCDASAGNGATESCNGLDDDCDESVDEDFPQLEEACTAGLGECAAGGFTECAPDGRGTQCDAEPPRPRPICATAWMTTATARRTRTTRRLDNPV